MPLHLKAYVRVSGLRPASARVCDCCSARWCLQPPAHAKFVSCRLWQGGGLAAARRPAGQTQQCSSSAARQPGRLSRLQHWVHAQRRPAAAAAAAADTHAGPVRLGFAHGRGLLRRCQWRRRASLRAGHSICAAGNPAAGPGCDGGGGSSAVCHVTAAACVAPRL